MKSTRGDMATADLMQTPAFDPQDRDLSAVERAVAQQPPLRDRAWIGVQLARGMAGGVLSQHEPVAPDHRFEIAVRDQHPPTAKGEDGRTRGDGVAASRLVAHRKARDRTVRRRGDGQWGGKGDQGN
jgi:hypothetical protein